MPVIPRQPYTNRGIGDTQKELSAKPGAVHYCFGGMVVTLKGQSSGYASPSPGVPSMISS